MITSLEYTAEGINLNGKPMIKVCHGPYLVGYFYTVEEVRARLERDGASLRDLKVKATE